MMHENCPCCGAEIIVGQESCTNCMIYLWDTVEDPKEEEEDR